ncbi:MULTISPECIES: type II toxin-antitoxin system Phd/YefM family antitoxin [Marinicauda]|jgi:antitoxin YefM|uniref:type II toxin-antitoxin system Phd/YefM family antitoxin n=1 Tax=Marinicauda TaxID=1649466 RepID=UPI0022E67DE3|nr:type II toxin-antitoxin system prevent-host-death family antitoxin [Marinicauda sp. Alg238-R41]
MTKRANIVSFTEARQGLKALMDRVTGDKSPAVITRRGAEPVVMVSLSEWESIQETNYLLKSPANAAELRKSLAEAETGETHELTEDDLRQLAEDPAAYFNE